MTRRREQVEYWMLWLADLTDVERAAVKAAVHATALPAEELMRLRTRYQRPKAKRAFKVARST